MNTGKKELESVLSKLSEIKLTHMASSLQSIYNQPAFVNMGKLELISTIVDAEYSVKMASRYDSRLTHAHLKGTACSLDQCVDSKERQYQPIDIVETLASLDFIRSGLNLCIFGASDSGKTYLAKKVASYFITDNSDFENGRRLAYYEMLDTIKNELILRDVDISKYGLNINLEELL